MSDTQERLKEGLADALGFLGGALAGYWIARWLGFDVFAQGYDSSSIVGILAVGLGGGLGVKLARSLKAAQGKG